MAASQTHQDTGVPAGFLALLLLATGLGLAAHWFEQDAANAALRLSAALCRPLALVSDHYARVLTALSAIEPGTKDMAFAWHTLSAVSRWYVWCVCAPLICLLVRRGWKASVSDVYRRTLSMRDLVRENTRCSACVAPALNWPGGLLSEPLDKGPWMAARTPLQLACDKHLLLQPGCPPSPVPRHLLIGQDNLPRADSLWLGRAQGGLFLDRVACQAWYAGQLGTRWRGWEALPPWLRKLAGAWALFAVNDKVLAQRLLDELSLSFRKPGSGTAVRARPGACEAGFWGLDSRMDQDTMLRVRKALAHKSVAQALRPHQCWEDLALLALYEQARSRGVLPTAEFIWLRPVRRQLYYLCNTAGRRTAWPEIAGAWAHYMAEKTLAGADPLAAGLMEPVVHEAVNAMEVALYEEGWISPDHLSRAVADNMDKLGLD